LGLPSGSALYPISWYINEMRRMDAAMRATLSHVLRVSTRILTDSAQHRKRLCASAGISLEFRFRLPVTDGDGRTHSGGEGCGEDKANKLARRLQNATTNVMPLLR
jgi:hypothetical protein